MAYIFTRKFTTKDKNTSVYYYVGWYEKKLIDGVMKNTLRVRALNTKLKSVAKERFIEFCIKNDKSKHDNIICSKYLDKYLEYGNQRRSGQKVNIRYVFKRFLRDLGDRRISDYSTEEIDMFLSKLRNQGLSLYTVKNYRTILQSAFQQALKWRYVKENPVFFTSVIKVPEPDILPFTKSEFRKFIESIDNEVFKDLVIFTLFTGLRANDVVNIKLCEINLEKKFIRIPATNLHCSKNQKTNWVEIADEIIPILQKYITGNKEYLFEGIRSGEKLSRNYLCNKVKLYVHSAGINPRLNHKSLRKTFACWLLEETNDISLVSKHLHHSSVSVTAKHYAKYLNINYTGITNLINYHN